MGKKQRRDAQKQADELAIQVLPLGAGQDVGRSCVVVSLGGRRIMFDCGMHLGYRDERRFPDFKLLTPTRRYDDVIDAVIITHFHLDHIGALPYFTEVCGYRGPVYMTYPTRAMAPLMLEDFHKILTDRGDGASFTRQHIKDCMARVIAVDLHQTVQVDPHFELCSYYAGHVLGAAMFHVRVGNQSVVYTGDYNTTPDRHLGAAAIPRLRPDLLISESTYATTIRDSRKGRERELLAAIHSTVKQGGKVLIPTFAVGRAQELLMLIDDFWERMNLQVPIYFSSALASRANLYYRLLLSWTHRDLRTAEGRRTAFGMERVQPWDRRYIHAPGPCVLFASPGMIHAGTSLEVFRVWALSEANLVLLPGYQVAGTLGRRLMNGETQGVQIDRSTKIDVKCKVRILGFSAHADVKGILSLTQQVSPAAVVLVHGEERSMGFLAGKITRTFGIPCHTPANGDLLNITANTDLPISMTEDLITDSLYQTEISQAIRSLESLHIPEPVNSSVVSGMLVARRAPDSSHTASLQLLSPSDALRQLLPQGQQLTLRYSCTIPVAVAGPAQVLIEPVAKRPAATATAVLVGAAHDGARPQHQGGNELQPQKGAPMQPNSVMETNQHLTASLAQQQDGCDTTQQWRARVVARAVACLTGLSFGSVSHGPDWLQVGSFTAKLIQLASGEQTCTTVVPDQSGDTDAAAGHVGTIAVQHTDAHDTGHLAALSDGLSTYDSVSHRVQTQLPDPQPSVSGQGLHDTTQTEHPELAWRCIWESDAQPWVHIMCRTLEAVPSTA